MRRRELIYEVLDRLARRALGRRPSWRQAMAEPSRLDLSTLRRALDPATISYGVMGGAATRLYQPERDVGDVDILVASDQLDDAEQALQAGGFERDGSSFRHRGGKPIDLVIRDAPWVSAALDAARDNLDPQGVPTLTLPFLVLTKIDSSRRKNRYDLSRMIGISEQRHGTRALREIREVIARHAPDQSRELERLIWLGRVELYALGGRI